MNSRVTVHNSPHGEALRGEAQRLVNLDEPSS
jgi:hypothetical protein